MVWDYIRKAKKFFEKEETEHEKRLREYNEIVKVYGADSPEAHDYLSIIREEQMEELQANMDEMEDIMAVEEELRDENSIEFDDDLENNEDLEDLLE